MFKNLESYEVETKRKGRRIVGDLLTFKDGKKAYMSAMRLADIYRDGEKSLSEAMRKGIACWWIEVSEFSSLEFDNVDVIGIRVKGTDDLYLARLEDFNDLSKAKTARIGYKDVKCLPVQYFIKREGEVIIT